LEAGSIHPFQMTLNFAGIFELGGVGLFFGEITNKRELEFLALACLDDANDPAHEHGQMDHYHYRQANEGNETQYVGADGHARQEKALKRMEPDEVILVVGCAEKEVNRGNEGDIGNHSCGIVLQTT
jgi:hypothetical protein